MRINVINPKHLADQHLVAEYREMKMSTKYYVRSAKTKHGIDKSKIGKRYTLNQGHAYMWYDKFAYIEKRFQLVCKEMISRGFTCNYNEIDYTGIPKSAFGDFTPTQADVKINLDRVLLRLDKQPKWYKFLGNNVQDWNKFYLEIYESGNLL
jgi:deoxyribonuclease (pyrimidine dimer)